MGRRTLAAVTALMALVGSALFLLFLSASPATLTIAVAQQGEDLPFIEALSTLLDQEGIGLRLRIARTPSLAANAEAVEKGDAHLAVVRSDIALPANAHTVAVLHEDTVILVAPGQSRIADIAELGGRRLGIVARDEADVRLAETILAYNGLTRDDVAIAPLTAQGLEKALSEGRIDAVLMVAAPGEARASAMIAALARVSRGPIAFIPIPQSDAIAQRFPAMEAAEIIAGAIGGRPPRPFESVRTIAVTHRLVARAALDAPTVAALTGFIFEMRPRLARLTPTANLVTAPDTKKSAALPIHQGAADYLDGNELTFFERYGDWFYIGITVIGFGGSIAAAVASRLARREHAKTDRILERLLAILTEARHARTEEVLERLSLDIDAQTAEAVAYARQHPGHADSVGALSLALEAARAAVAERRDSLANRRRGRDDEAAPETRLATLGRRGASSRA
ncbi:TAXI family TRAP transporter solute-binding subunit [Chelatococcus sp. SYSU_G07232]|uniref:TAXI family TRAP transporter solute-binding subunit n=1 Tax=Chelatococcus albus TaxID=3047466 RepID=A0ABT7AHM3_9HYPH|nr:TAXI family TRAP transporter solute-binding subunit [Chelatococcus sp. SYSU_G07232]MDJ1158877.1 TAXI family TRAP transporter solute-binding subunit [Chelatococcus sp. SYSU_G07232]